MKKRLYLVFLMITVALAVFAFASCSDCKHEFGAYTQTKAPTCTEAGENTAECSKCGEKDVIAVDPIGHSGKWETTKAETCTEDGEKKLTCSRCSNTVTEAIPAAHVLVDETIAATCVSDGEQKKACSRCDYEEVTKLSAKGHSWQPIGDNAVASCTIGSTQCTSCGASQGLSNPSDHSALNASDTCSRCGFQCFTTGTDGSKLMYHTTSGTMYAEYYGTTADNSFSSYSNILADYISNEVETVNRTPYGIKLVVFEEGSKVKTISDYAFRGSSITSITIPASVETLYTQDYSIDGAFSDCYSLRSVTFESGSKLKTIGDYSFKYCTALESITIPASVENIGNAAFSHDSSLKNIKIENGSKLTKVGFRAFDETAWWNDQQDGSVVYLDNICLGYKGDAPMNTSLSIKNGTTVIADYAFQGEGGIISVNIPGSVKYIGESAFNNCSALSIVSGGEGVEICSNSAFSGTAWVSTPTNYESGLLYLGKIIYKVEKGAVPSTLVIKDGVKSIPDSAFYGCTGLTGVTIPSSVTSIGEKAFYNCTGLTSITIPENVETIGAAAFSGCTGLTVINFNARNCADVDTDYYGGPFTSAGNLGNGITLVFGEQVTRIPAYLFANCYPGTVYDPYIKSVYIPKNIKVIGECAFYTYYYSSTLTSIVFEQPDGWSAKFVGSWNGSDISSLQLNSPSNNAVYLNRTYKDYVWSCVN